MNKDETFSAKAGRLLGQVFVGCISACLCAVVIALTVRFIAWLF